MIRAFQWDLARQVERLDWLLAQLPRYAEWGYNELYLHFEDAIEYPSLPGVARRDAYTYREMTRLVNAAQRVGINIVPIVNLLGHTQYLIKVPELRDLNELRAPDGSPLERGQICPVHPRTLEVADKLLRDVAPFCTAGKVHVGLDESFHLGKHPRSRAEIARIGRAAHFGRYVGRLRELTRSHRLEMGMWGDMLYFLPGAIPLLPRDVAVYEWYYYGFTRRPRIELFNFKESNLGEKLRARGLAYWGCPMNGAFRYEPMPHFTDRLENAIAWWERCRQLNAAGFLVTSWEPNRLAIELTTVIDAAIASLWLDGDQADTRTLLERGFARVYGTSRRDTTPAPVDRGREARTLARKTPAFPRVVQRMARAAASVALACDRYPFSGYPRWESNSRWDIVSRREPLASYRAEERWFATLARQAGRLPVALRASVELRWCLATRDRIIREASRSEDIELAKALDSALRAGRSAARTMWAGSRNPRAPGPNEEILLADQARVRRWQAGEPVFGPRWQLCYRVDNFAPAAQLVGVEQQQADNTWARVQACHTIEFQSRAAKPRGGLVRDHAAPIDWNGDRASPPRLRFILCGLGQVRVRDVVLTDGTTRYSVRVATRTLGRPAPSRGFPNLDWMQIRAVMPIKIVIRAR